MRCRHFTIRFTTQHTHDDEARINEFLQGVHIHSVQTSVSAPGCCSVLIFYEEAPSQLSKPNRSSNSLPETTILQPEEPTLTTEQRRIYDQLREWRGKRAAAEGKPAYVIAHNAVLMHIAQHHMTIHTAEDLARIKHFGPARTTRYGPELLQILALLTTSTEAPLFEDMDP